MSGRGREKVARWVWRGGERRKGQRMAKRGRGRRARGVFVRARSRAPLLSSPHASCPGGAWLGRLSMRTLNR